MARYIDAERFDVVTFQRCSEDFMDGMDYILDMIENAPTEDVVPISEVEEIVKFKDMTYAELKSLFIEAKQEVAREIFDKYGNYNFPTEPKDNFNNTLASLDMSVNKDEVGIECPCCHGTGGIGTSDWLTKRFTKKQMAEMKEQAIREADEELERKAKQEVAREIFEEIVIILKRYESYTRNFESKIGELAVTDIGCEIAELKNKYI